MEHSRILVRDEIAGFSRKAILRWRLKPGQWRLDGVVVSDGHHVVSVSASMPIARIVLVQGWESRYYLQKSAAPVLEVEMNQPGAVSTEYRWTS